MAQKLEYNDKVVSVTPVDIPLFESDVEVIQKLDNEPNDVGGLSADDLKRAFDTGAMELKEYINGALVPRVVSDSLTEQARAQAEAERVANEQERVSNENQRIANEEARCVFEPWSASKTYVPGNKVAYGGNSYVCIRNADGTSIPTPNGSDRYWLMIARRGIAPTVTTENVDGGTDIIITYGENEDEVRLFVPTPSVGEIVEGVLNALPTWDGGVY